ncbi:Succinate-semialdehyde dehydrogenase [NADP+] [Pseudoalteromonas luteoviolacea B = ATCC 29581]|nr:Succinate-semialdehyde dehydrogenase [NADP+] [Pseudoalteromonas luteoviolacea B = ATCC 29581]
MYELKEIHTLLNLPERQADAIEVVDPASGEVVGYVNPTARTELKSTVQRARIGFHYLRNASSLYRSKLLRCWHDLVLENKNILAQLVTLESGKPLSESLAEVDYAAGFIAWFSEEAKRSYGTTIPSTASNQLLETIKQPVGVVFGITPWNFPLAMITRKVAPAVAAGCSFILKPSERTPLSALALFELAKKAGFPPEIWQLVHSQDPQALASYFCHDPEVKKVTFTGSTHVGRSLMMQSAQQIKKVSLELGGNAPFIVFESANIDNAIAGLMAAKFRNAGQTCVAANRVLVAKSCKEAFLAQLMTRVKALKMGHGLLPETLLGPLISMEAKNKASVTVAKAISQGATCLYQGQVHEGAFFPATILSDVTQDMDIAQQELFAPIITIMSFESEEQALNIANSVPEGLASYFFSEDVSQIVRVSRALDYGMVGINTGMVSNPVAPFGGIKQSGLGREGGKEGLDDYLETKFLCQVFD